MSRSARNWVSERQWLFGTPSTWQIMLCGDTGVGHTCPQRQRAEAGGPRGSGQRWVWESIACLWQPRLGFWVVTRTLIRHSLQCGRGAPRPRDRTFSAPVLKLLSDEIVALKRLKMEKEKEGFPITSLREINTILKAQHPNIVTVRVRQPHGQARQSSCCHQSLSWGLGPPRRTGGHGQDLLLTLGDSRGQQHGQDLHRHELRGA